MRQIPVIRKTLAALLLLVFTLASAPKAYFHDLLADHVDALSCDQLHKTSVLHKKTIDCDCDDLVVTTPFVVQPATVSPFAVSYFDKEYSAVYTSSSQCFVQYSDTRGPPAA